MTAEPQPADLLAPLLELAETLGSATDTTDSGLPVTVAECLDVMHATADELRSLAAHRGEVEPVTPERGRIEEAFSHVQSLVLFAYLQGFHELGYQPERVLFDAAISAVSARAERADGWVLVPREPTHEMCAATIGKKTGGWATQRMRNAFNTWIKMVAASPPHPPQAQAGAGDATLAWAVERWHAEVANRPLQNVHRRSLDDVWRQVIRHCGADDVSLCGPRHDQLRAALEAKP